MREAQSELAKQNLVPQLEQSFDRLLKRLKEEFPSEAQDRAEGGLKLQLENSYLQTKLIKLVKTESDRARQEVELGFAKKEVRFLAEKNLTLEKERSTLIKTIESQEKCIEELRDAVKANRQEQLSMGIMSSQKKSPPDECSISAIEDAHNSLSPSHSINIVEKVLEMYKKLEEKHSSIQNMLASCSDVACSRCS